MATKYVTLKDSNGDTLYPQAVATNLAPGSIGTTELANSAVTPSKIDWSSMGSFGPTGGPSSATSKSLPGDYEYVAFFTKDVPLKAGTYLAVFQSLLNIYGSTVSEINARCIDTTNSNTIVAGGWAIPGVNGWQQVIGFGEYTVASDGTHTISYGMSSSSAVSNARFSANRTQVSFVRIA